MYSSDADLLTYDFLGACTDSLMHKLYGIVEFTGHKSSSIHEKENQISSLETKSFVSSPRKKSETHSKIEFFCSQLLYATKSRIGCGKSKTEKSQKRAEQDPNLNTY